MTYFQRWGPKTYIEPNEKQKLNFCSMVGPWYASSLVTNLTELQDLKRKIVTMKAFAENNMPRANIAEDVKLEMEVGTCILKLRSLCDKMLRSQDCAQKKHSEELREVYDALIPFYNTVLVEGDLDLPTIDRFFVAIYGQSITRC